MAILLRNQFLEISHDKGNEWLYMNWKGYQIDESIKEDCNRAVELRKEYQVFKILNDNTYTQGIWLGVSRWLASDALPRARRAGMTSFAHVHGPSRMSRISAEAALFLLSSDTSDIKAFDDIETAKAWLRGRS